MNSHLKVRLQKGWIDIVNESSGPLTGPSEVSPESGRQTDFVQLLRDNSDSPETLYAKITGDRRLEVLVPYKGTRCAHYDFGKNLHDDFMLFRGGAVSELVVKPSGQPDGAPHIDAAKRYDVLKPWSNKEYALCVSPAGSGHPHQWLPEHNRTGTVFAVSQQLFIDDEEVTDWSGQAGFRPVQSVRLVQRMIGIHPDDRSRPIAEIDCSHTVDRRGVTVRSKIIWLYPVSIGSGYGMMVPIEGSFAYKLVTSLGRVYDATATDRSRTNLLDDDQAVSYAFLHRPDAEDGRSNTVAAMTIHDIGSTLRYGQEGRRRNNPVVWLEHRNEQIQKLYPQVFDQYTAQAGDFYEAAGVYFVGELPESHPLLTRRD